MTYLQERVVIEQGKATVDTVVKRVVKELVHAPMIGNEERTVQSPAELLAAFPLPQAVAEAIEVTSALRRRPSECQR